MTTTETTTPEADQTSDAHQLEPTSAPEATAEKPTNNETPLSEVLVMTVDDGFAPAPVTDEPPTEGRARHPRPLTPERIAELTAELAVTRTGRKSLEVDPDDLVFGRNIRTNAQNTLHAEFLAEIAERGFDQSPTVWINDAGYLQVKTGHRRTLAARKVNYRPCSVMLVTPPQGEDTTQQRRAEIGTQWAENHHHEAMTEEDEIGAVQELLDLGVTPAAVHRELKTISTEKAAAVSRMRKAPAAEIAKAAALAGQLDLVQAATAAELEPTKDEMQRLTQAAKKNQFDREVFAIERDRRSNAALKKARADYAKKGYTILERQPGYYDKPKPTPLEELETPGGRKADRTDVTSPADWAVLLRYEEQPVHTETGKPVAERDIDPATYLDPTAAPAEGKLHAESVRYDPTIVPRFWCLDRKHAGLRKAKTGEGTNRERAEAAARSRKANEAARTDTLARRKFVLGKMIKAGVTTGLTRDELPKGVLQWVTHVVLTDTDIFMKGREIAAEWFGLKGEHPTAKLPGVLGYNDKAAADKQKASDQRTTLILAALAMAATEARMQPDEGRPHYWRILQYNPHIKRVGDTTASARYLRVLIAAGYNPGPIERAVLGEITLAQAIEEAEKTAAAQTAAA